MRAFFTIRAPLVSWIVAVAFFMETLDATVIVTALPKIAQSFGVSPIEASIGVTAYLLALGIVLPASGWIADRFGPRNVFAAAIVVFTATSLACAASTSLPMFVAARALQGAAGALMSPVGRLVVLRNTPQDRRIEAIGLITWPGLIGPVIGPPLGGFIAEYWGWHWIFLINAPLGLIGFGLVLRFIGNSRPAERRSFDWRGFVLLAGGLASLIAAIDFLGAVQYSLLSAGFAVSACILGVVAWRRMKTTAAPLMRVDSLRTPSFFVANVTGGALTRVVMMATPFLAPLFFQIGFGLGAAQAGLMVLPYFLGNLLMKMATTPLLRTFGFWRITVSTALLNATFLGIFALMPPPTSQPILWLYAGLLFCAGLSRSMSMTGMATLTFADIRPEQMTDANTLSAVSWQITQAVAVALASLLLRFSALLRDEAASAIDFRIAFGALVGLCLLAALFYGRMKRDAGEALTAKS